MTPSTNCPVCGGTIHPLAGRCKHCKANLAELRERANRAARAYSMGAVVGPAPNPSPLASGPPQLGHRAPKTAPVAGVPGQPVPGGAATASQAALRHATASGPSQGSQAAAAPHRAAPRFAAASPPRGTPGTNANRTSDGRLSRAADVSAGRDRSQLVRRWPQVVSAIALVIIGVSIGVLAERWLSAPDTSSTDGRVRAAALSPHRIPDPMPSPILPGPAAPHAVPGSPTAPPGSAPFAAPTQPTPGTPPGGSLGGLGKASGGGDAEAFRAFTSGLAGGVCQKLSSCGIIDGSTALLCQAFVSTFDTEEAADKIARGECSFSQKAADACLQAIGTLSCDPTGTNGMMGGLGGMGLGGLGGGGGLGNMMDLLGAHAGFAQCAEAFSCL